MPDINNPNKKTCSVIQHVAFEGLGSFEQVLDPKSWELQWYMAPIDNLLSAKDSDLCIILGGPIGVYETKAYPFLEDELSLAKHRIDNQLPTLGICLGAQILAQAGGGKVYPGTKGKELGWSTLKFQPQASTHFLAPLMKAQTPVLHWHGDTFDLPPKATLWASSDLYENQIFTLGTSILGFQCHPEARARDLELWFVGHALEISQTQDTSVKSLRADSNTCGPKLEGPAQATFRLWLRELGLVG